MALTKVDKSVIEATGTASATTFLRGDGSWNAPPSSGFIGYTVYTGGDTWTKTDNNPTKLLVEVQGGGGGGGGGGVGKGDGGGGGGYARVYLDVSSIDTATITVGAAAAGGGSNSPGTAGNLSSFVKASGSGSFTDIIGNGGAAGQNNNLGGGIGGTATGPTGGLYIQGGRGGGYTNENNVGGGSFYSPQHYSGSSGTPNPSDPTTGYGGGGEGSRGTTGNSGAGGTAGVVIVWEYK